MSAAPSPSFTSKPWSYSSRVGRARDDAVEAIAWQYSIILRTRCLKFVAPTICR